MLIKLAPYSFETVLCLGTGNVLRLLKGFSRLYHGLSPLDCGLSDSTVRLEVVVVCVTVLVAPGGACFSGSDKEISLSDTAYSKGSLVTGIDVCAKSAGTSSWVEWWSCSWSIGLDMFRMALYIHEDQK